ncbi:hypothetical protein MFRU_002g04050 [Monilinia fructicola]|nr:hypothetical protein MFRU_002g04050 [Monilinia fructicola]
MLPSSLRKLMANQTMATTPTRPAILVPGQIPTHRWISFSGETLVLSINFTEEKRPPPSVVNDFNTLVQLYAMYTKTCLVTVTLPQYRFDVHGSDHSEVFFDLVSILNQFPRLSRIEITICQPFYNFIQLTNACYFYRLKFRDWKLFRMVGTWTFEQILVGSRIDWELHKWFKDNIAGTP